MSQTLPLSQQPESSQDRAQQYFQDLRNRICQIFEDIEHKACTEKSSESAKFQRSSWERPGGGGGVMSLLKGRVFEKVGVNVSTVYGELSQEFRAQIPGAQENPNFWASGLSLVAHLCSPLVPAVHMNIRHIVTTKAWFGGGTDLTPYYPREEDTRHFHQCLKAACDAHDPQYYPNFKKWCDAYFFLPHRQEPRGVGGIFFDDLCTGDWEKDFSFVKSVGEAFLEAYPPLVYKHMATPWTSEQRAHQLRRRGRYVEFNLLYDRGTLFGLKTGGNIEAILMSLPPVVHWDAPVTNALS